MPTVKPSPNPSVSQSLLHELTLIDHPWLSKLVGLHIGWAERGQRLKVNQHPYLVSFLMCGFHSASSIFAILRPFIQKKLYDTPIQINQLWITLFLVSSTSCMTFSSLNMYRKAPLVEPFFNEMRKFEMRLESGHPGREVPARVRKLVRVAVRTCQACRMSSKSIVLTVVVLSAAYPDLQLNYLLLYPANLILEGMELVKGEWSRVGWALEKVVTAVWNLIFWRMVAEGWITLVNMIVVSSCGLTAAVLLAQEGNKSYLSVISSLRQVHILAGMFNQISATLLVVALINAMNLQLVCGLNLIKAGDPQFGGVGPTMLCFFVLMLLQGIIGVNMIFGFCASVYETSTKCLEGMNREARRKGQVNKLFKRAVRSVPAIKVHFGGMNFIEKMTPVVFQQFCLQRIVDCLLVSKR